MEFEDKRALVTGGTKGIGRAVARALIDRGARVAVTGRREEALKKAAEAMGALALPGDVSRESDAEEAVKAVVERWGGIDILVNNAAVVDFAPLVEVDPQRFEEVLNINVKGAMLMARAAVPHFIRQKGGNIVNISSTAGLRGFAGGSAYVASKFALKGMSECWRAELRPHNVRVILVNPSEVQTNPGRPDEPSKLDPRKLTAKEIADTVVSALAMNDRGFIPEVTVFATNPF
jgi:3-oxoacyl-[acyl-carrier protein] reductase